MIQPDAGKSGGGKSGGGKPGPEPVPEQTIIQGKRREAVSPGDTMAQGGLDRTVDMGDVEPAEQDAPSRQGTASRSAPPAAATAKADSGVGKVFAGRFEVLQKLGEGGMGVVYRAKDREIEGREIALKVLRPRFSRNAKFRELFFREIHAAQGFVSEHVVQVRDTGKSTDGTLFLTMDLVDGEPLDEVLVRESMLNERHALEIARQTLLALASGHDQGFVHRDIKPSNVMLARRMAKTDENPFGVGVRLLDFGIASLTATLEEGQVIGTPRYMSPEQVQGQRLDGRSDLFSVGVMLYEMLSGSRPFDGDTPEELRTAILETNIAPMITELDNLSEPIRKLLQKALQKNRDKRFQSAADFAHAIEKSRAFREKRGVPAWLGGGFFLSVVAVGGLGWMVYDQGNKYNELQTKYGDVGSAHAQEIVKLEAEHQKALEEVRNDREQMRNQVVAAEAELKLEKSKSAQAAKESAAAETARLEALADKQNLEQRVRELEDRVNKQDDSMKKDVLAGELFDDVRDLINGGSPATAQQTWEKRKEAIPETEGAVHLQQVVAAAAALDAAAKVLLADTATVPATKERNAAQQDFNSGNASLKLAEASAGDFQLLAKKWISSKKIGRQDEPDRVADLQQIREQLAVRADAIRTRLDGIRIAVEDEIRAEREQLAKIAAGDDPANLFDHLRTYPDDTSWAADTIDRLAAQAERDCAPGGQLDLDRLDGNEAIRKWGEFLTADGSDLAGKGADTWRWLWAARRWFEGDQLTDPAFAFVETRPKLVATTPSSDWRAQLALQRALAKEIGSFLVAGRGKAVYRDLNAAGKKVWYLEEMEVESGATDRGNILRKPIDESGTEGHPQPIPISVDDRRVLIAGDITLDVRANGPDVRVALWRPRLVDPLPYDQSWASTMKGARSTQEIGKGLPCLVFDVGNTQFWFAPDFGLVRHVVEGRFERELRYTARVR
ncbi:MAG: serine/threonine protein kinase [Planctomycetes bacterium]|nr:serine/threonine protein kinase [Planctomycetota bacterium]